MLFVQRTHLVNPTTGIGQSWAKPGAIIRLFLGSDGRTSKHDCIRGNGATWLSVADSGLRCCPGESERACQADALAGSPWDRRRSADHCDFGLAPPLP